MRKNHFPQAGYRKRLAIGVPQLPNERASIRIESIDVAWPFDVTDEQRVAELAEPGRREDERPGTADSALIYHAWLDKDCPTPVYSTTTRVKTNRTNAFQQSAF
jgi:hypothetical protein